MKGVGLIITISILLLSVMAMYTGEQMYLDDVENNISRNITTDVEELFNWTAGEVLTYEGRGIDRIANVVNKAVDFMGYTSFEMSKGFIEYGYENPGIVNFKRLIHSTQALIFGIMLMMFFYPVMLLTMIIMVGAKMLYELFKKLKLKYMKEDE